MLNYSDLVDDEASLATAQMLGYVTDWICAVRHPPQVSGVYLTDDTNGSSTWNEKGYQYYSIHNAEWSDTEGSPDQAVATHERRGSAHIAFDGLVYCGVTQRYLDSLKGEV